MLVMGACVHWIPVSGFHTGLFAWEGGNVLPRKFRGVWGYPSRKAFLEFSFSEVDFSAILIYIYSYA